MTFPTALAAALDEAYAAFADAPPPRKLEASPLRDAKAIHQTLTHRPLRTWRMPTSALIRAGRSRPSAQRATTSTSCRVSSNWPCAILAGWAQSPLSSPRSSGRRTGEHGLPPSRPPSRRSSRPPSRHHWRHGNLGLKRKTGSLAWPYCSAKPRASGSLALSDVLSRRSRSGQLRPKLAGG